MTSTTTRSSKDHLLLDGSSGEGGGQILRSALTLSLITGRPFRVEKIRAGRPRPGLMRQHLAAVRAAAELCGAETTGAEVGSTVLDFSPGQPCPPQQAYEYAIGTAGSTSLVLQTILFPLLARGQKAELRVTGGTHNPFAPPFEFLAQTWLPCLQAMGWKLELELQRYGFCPAGGGALCARMGAGKSLEEFRLLERGEPQGHRVVVLLADGLPEEIGAREVKVVRRALGEDLESDVRLVRDSACPGNVVLVECRFAHITEVFVGFGARGRPAEAVAKEAAQQARRYLQAEAPVGDHLADQLLLPLALGKGGVFRTLALSRHFISNRDVIQQFLDVEIKTTREDRLSWLVEVKP